MSAANHALYLWQGRKIIELKLDARAERVVFEYDGGWRLPVFSHAGRISLDKPADFNRWGAANAKPFIQLFRWNRQHYVGPKILAYHRSTFNDQYAHCHPRFTPDGKSVLYTSDLTSYAKYVSGGNRRL